MIGILLGIESIFGFVIGLNIVGIYITIFQVILGNSMQSAKYYNDSIFLVLTKFLLDSIYDESHRKAQVNNTEI